MKEAHYRKGLKTFVELINVANDNKQLVELFDFLLTPNEREDIALRCILVHELISEERTQREIANTYNASITKITRGSNSLKRISRKFRTLLQNYFSKNSWRS